MDHLSIYENGIVNPYKNKGELSKSFLCPPAQTGGVKKACISTRTVILMVITMVSTISYVLHLHLSKESVAISKSLLRGSKFKDSTKRNIIELDKIVTAEDNNSIKEIEKIVEDTKTIVAVKPEYVPQRKTISILLNALNQSLTSSKVTEMNILQKGQLRGVSPIDIKQSIRPDVIENELNASTLNILPNNRVGILDSSITLKEFSSPIDFKTITPSKKVPSILIDNLRYFTKL